MNQHDVAHVLRSDPVAVALLSSTVPARLAYTGGDGTPRVLPIWFHFDGESLILASREDTAKVRALVRHPEVALTIDSEAPPYRILQLRGRAEIEVAPGIVPEYERMAARYYGPDLGARWIERMRDRTTSMARIAVRPSWVKVFDVGEIFPESRG